MQVLTRVSHPKSVERAGLQVLHFCTGAGATLGKPLSAVLFTVLHLHNTHSQLDASRRFDKCYKELKTSSSQYTPWRVHVFYQEGSRNTVLSRPQHCHSSAADPEEGPALPYKHRRQTQWNREDKTYPFHVNLSCSMSDFSDCAANVDLHPSGVRSVRISLVLCCLLRHWVCTFTW